ncbi:MAG: hypothetical protein K9I84_11880 [Leadbetterella sp.]|nr:hypothetical protein [Leadbetterella sp.]
MDVYLDYEFLENFLLSDDESELFVRLKSFIKESKNKNNLILNFDPIEFYDDPEKQIIVRHLSQRLDAKIEVNCLSQKIDFIAEKANPCSLFLSDLLEDDIEYYGYLHAKSKNYQTLEKILFSDPLPITGQYKNWNFLHTYKVPCNAIVFSDNYLFTNDIGYENLKSILSNLLPEKLKVTFDLTIIGYDPKKQHIQIQKTYQEISEFLKLSFNYNINLTIIREDSHERAIYSNLAKFSTHKGFSLFNNSKIKSKDEMTLSYTPVGAKTLSGTSMESFSIEIEKLKKIARVQRMPDKEIGNKQNRLFTINK